VQSTRLAESFELLTGSAALTRLEKFSRKATCDLVVLVQKSPKPARRKSFNLTVDAGCPQYHFIVSVTIALLIQRLSVQQLKRSLVC